MRCQRCGFELEPGQTFCGMCGAEQSRDLHKKKKKFNPKSILWIIRVVSKAHLFMWLVFLANVAVAVVTGILAFNTSVATTKTPLMLTAFFASIVLLAYELFYILMGYKNPNTTKTQAFKVRYRLCFIVLILIIVITVFYDPRGFAGFCNNFWYHGS